MESPKFTRNETNIVKGLAILAMVFHHACPNNAALSIIHWESVDIQTIMASSGKVCVALLTILSGYGLSESYKKFKNHSLRGGVRFVLSHYFQLLSMYWCFYAWVYASHSMMWKNFNILYGSGLKGLVDFVIDLFGLGMIGHGTVLIGGWYLSAIVALYFLFPLLHLTVKKLGWCAIALTYLPWVWYIYVGDLNMHTDVWYFYVVSFVVGIYLSQKMALDRIMRLQGMRWVWGAIAFFFVALLGRLFFTLPWDPILALACIVLVVLVLRKIILVRSFLVCLGGLSAGIWLLHMYVAGLIQRLSFETFYGRFALLLALTVGIVMIVEEMKKSVKFGDGVKKIRGFIECGSWPRM